MQGRVSDRSQQAIVLGLESGDSYMKQSGEIQANTVNRVTAGSVELETVSLMVDAQGKGPSPKGTGS
jgi:hypothetical protein